MMMNRATAMTLMNNITKTRFAMFSSVFLQFSNFFSLSLSWYVKGEGRRMSRVGGGRIHPYSKAVMEKLTSLLFLVLSFYYFLCCLSLYLYAFHMRVSISVCCLYGCLSFMLLLLPCAFASSDRMSKQACREKRLKNGGEKTLLLFRGAHARFRL